MAIGTVLDVTLSLMDFGRVHGGRPMMALKPSPVTQNPAAIGWIMNSLTGDVQGDTSRLCQKRQQQKAKGDAVRVSAKDHSSEESAVEVPPSIHAFIGDRQIGDPTSVNFAEPANTMGLRILGQSALGIPRSSRQQRITQLPTE
ncbi:MAG: hypothetical protein AAF492_19715 [Verrucomicrobiota bacterium]